MGQIVAYLDKDLIEDLNEHTQTSPLCRSELIGVAIRRFLREERRGDPAPKAEAQVAQRMARGEIPSHVVDGTGMARRGAPWGN